VIYNSTPYTSYTSEICRSWDCVITDRAGREYIDFEAGVWCLSVGHNHPGVNQAIMNQLSQISHVGYRYSTEGVELASRELLEVSPYKEGSCCVFLSSGSEAVEYGIQAVQALTQKPYVLKLDGFYLSAYGRANGSGTIGINPRNDSIQDLDRIPFDQVSAFVFEPGNCSGQVYFPDEALIHEIIRRTREAGGYVLADEVTTGIGRTGRWFGFEHYGIRPDVIACGKGLGNGYPVSAVLLSPEISQQLAKSPFLYAQSHQNDPLGCAVVREVLSIIKEDCFLENAEVTGHYLLQRLNELGCFHPQIAEVRGRGLLVALEFKAAFKESLPQLHKELFQAGFVVGFHPSRPVFRFYPPLSITAGQIDALAEALGRLLETEAYRDNSLKHA
jgi:acetylornithine/N-succinyldiaminopimelate aminotransferase